MSKKMMDASERSEDSMDDKQAYFLSKKATNMESNIVFEIDREFAISLVLMFLHLQPRRQESR